MWSVILATLRLALTPLTIAQALIRNLDANREGIDDKIADALEESIEVILAVVSTDDTVPGQARGLVAVSAFCRKVLADLDTILALGPPWTEEQKAAAQALNDSLWDEAKVYQAKRGADAEVLTAAKESAKEKLGVILQTG